MEQQLIRKYNIKEKLKLYVTDFKRSMIIGLFTFLVSRLAITNGISPFSQSFLIASGGRLFTLLFSLTGILTSKIAYKHKYIYILLFSFTIYNFLKHLYGSKYADKSAPFILFGSSFIFGCIFVFSSDYVAYDVLLILLDAFVSAIFFFIVKNFIWIVDKKQNKTFFTAEEYTAPLIILCLIVAGIGDISLPYGITVRNILCVYIVLVTALYANLGTVAQIAVFMGISAGLGMDYFPLYLTYYPFNSLVCSTFSKYGKIASVLGFTIGNIIISILLAGEKYMIITFQDIALSAIFFALTPEKILGRFNQFFNAKALQFDNALAIKNVATTKLDRLASALKKLSDTIKTTDEKKSINHEPIYKSVCENICNKCSKRFFCWDKEYTSTVNDLDVIIKTLTESGNSTRDNIPERFISKCKKADEVLNQITYAFEIIRLNAVWENRFNENVRVFREQFSELSYIISTLKKQIDKNPFFDKNLSGRIVSELEAKGLLTKNLSILKDKNDRYEIDITLFPCNIHGNSCHNIISSVLYDIFGFVFIKAQGKCSFNECHLLFCEAEIYDLDISIQQNSKDKNESNGDSWSVNRLDNGSKYTVLCDGSGSGNNAKYYSDRTVKLLEQFLKTGFSRASAIKLINSSFINSDIKEYFSTVDLCITDLKTGKLEILKKGAPPTYIIRSNGEYDIINSTTLPLGVFRSEKGNVKQTFLNENDIVITVSDGICDSIDKEDWIIDALSVIKSRNTEEIASFIMKIANSASENNDDKTIIVSKLKKANNV